MSALDPRLGIRPAADVEAELDEELRFHLDMRREGYEASGATADEADRRAQRKSGAVSFIRAQAPTMDQRVNRRPARDHVRNSSGCSLCATPDSPDAGVYRRRYPDARPRYWGDDSGVQRRRWRPAATVALRLGRATSVAARDSGIGQRNALCTT